MTQELKRIEIDIQKEDWEEAIRNPKIENLLVSLNETGSKLEPIFDLEHGYRYPEAEKLLEDNPQETLETLKKMSDLDILNEELYDKTIRCPKCNSPNVSTNYTCPFDGSKDVTRDSLITHLTCGYIDSRSNFAHDDGLVCPRCKQTLTPGSYRVTGTWSQCNVCGKRLEALSTDHRCRSCGHEFTFEDATFKNSYVYTLSDKVKEELSRGLAHLNQFRKALEDIGYSIIIPSILRDTSGKEFEFDIVAKDSEDLIITVDVNFSDSPITSNQLMEKFAQYSVMKKTSFLILVPPLGSELNKLAESLAMKIIQATDAPRAINQFSEKIAKLTPTRAPEPQKKSGIFSGARARKIRDLFNIT